MDRELRQWEVGTLAQLDAEPQAGINFNFGYTATLSDGRTITVSDAYEAELRAEDLGLAVVSMTARR